MNISYVSFLTPFLWETGLDFVIFTISNNFLVNN
jgi:hypothetical protein